MVSDLVMTGRRPTGQLDVGRVLTLLWLRRFRISINLHFAQMNFVKSLACRTSETYLIGT